MKVFVRVLTILVAALVVVGITFALDQSGAIQINAPTRPDTMEFTLPISSTDGASVDATDEDRVMRPPEGDLDSLVWRGASDLLQSLAVVSVIVVLFVGGKFVWRSVWGRHRGPPQSGQATAVTPT